MIDWLSNWAGGIVIAVIIGTIIELITTIKNDIIIIIFLIMLLSFNITSFGAVIFNPQYLPFDNSKGVKEYV